jgi:glycine cleavage system H lipoate-binding protein
MEDREQAMRCPFLREAQTKFCRVSAFRKMIVREPGQADNDRCFTPDHVGCPAFTAHEEHNPGTGHCPFLEEAHIQYCGAASVVKYIPYTEEVLSQCGTDRHNYCELFLSIAQPDRTHLPATDADPSAADAGRCQEHLVDGVHVPGWLWYSPNHMWLDVGERGNVHIGVDAFLAGMLGGIEGVSFATAQGLCRPAAFVSVRGIDLQLVFPRQVNISHPNAALTTHPDRLLTDPYTRGWLFEGEIETSGSSRAFPPVRDGLVTGVQAVGWMRDEVQRAGLWAHKMSCQADPHVGVVMADGGGIRAGLVQQLQREQALQFFNDFFSPLASWQESK